MDLTVLSFQRKKNYNLVFDIFNINNQQIQKKIIKNKNNIFRNTFGANYLIQACDQMISLKEIDINFKMIDVGIHSLLLFSFYANN